MNVLALDTSSDVGTVAVVSEGFLRAEIAAEGRARHGEQLLIHVERALEAAGLGLGDVGLLAVGVGPGSFTGLRVGLAAAKGLALAEGLPLVGVSSMRALARGLGVGGDAVAAPVVDAHRGEVFVGAFGLRGAGPVSEVMPVFHAPPEEAARRLRQAVSSHTLALCGSGVRRHAKAMAAALGPGSVVAPAVWDAPRASLVALEGLDRFERAGPDDLVSLEPWYLKPSDAKLPGGGPG